MRFPRSLHTRLTLAYAAALLIALGGFAAVSAFFLFRLYEGQLDARLHVTAIGLRAFGDDIGDRLVLDKQDAAQFMRAVTPDLDGAIFRMDGSVAVATAAGIPLAIRNAVMTSGTSTTMQTVDAGPGGGELRLALSAFGRATRVGTVAVWASTQRVDDFRRLVALVFIIAIPLIVGTAVFSAGIVTRRGLSPLRDIAALATRIEATDLSLRLNPPSEQDELGSLSATFDRMLDRLQAAFARQRRFTADASHELRAPLSVIRAESDLALARRRQPEEYQRALESIASEADRLEELIDDLLALARAESGWPQVETAVDLAPLVKEAVQRLDAVARSRGVRVEPDIADGAVVAGDPSALARVPLALLHNGVKYARDGGYVRVQLRRDDGDVRLTVVDDGAGFTKDGLKRATERFWRDDRVRGRGGSGLGLAIVRAIVEQAGGEIELGNAPNAGAQVNVRFPAVLQKS